MVKQVYTGDLKSPAVMACRFDSGPGDQRKIMATTERGYILYLSQTEAEVLRVYLDQTMKFGADMDPMYEDWDWLRIKRCLEGISEELPEAL